VLVDVDLSILGEAPERFDEYEDQVREEYSWAPAVVFRATRREILRGFLARASIFNTTKFAEAYEARARANLERPSSDWGLTTRSKMDAARGFAFTRAVQRGR
jgi:predicted metal-dependent HD superfamily phosphohydrolase